MTSFESSLLSSFMFPIIPICVNKVLHVQKLEGIIFFALDFIYDIIFLSFFLEYVYMKLWISIINWTNQLYCKCFHLTVLGQRVGYDLGRILYNSLKINWGYLIGPMTEPCYDVCICWLFVCYIRLFSNISLYNMPKRIKG